MSDENGFAVLDALYEELTAAATAGDSEHYASLFIQTGTLMPPGASVLVGRTAVCNWIRRFLADYELKIATFTVDDRAIGDTVGFCRWSATGTYRLRGGESFRFDQKYLDTVVKDSDGKWKFAAHMWSPNTMDWGVWADFS